MTVRFCYLGDAPDERFVRSLAAACCAPADVPACTTGPGPTRALVVRSAKSVAASRKTDAASSAWWKPASRATAAVNDLK